jgi:hypothetical protein
MGRIVIVGYKPKPGKNEELRALAREHVPILRDEGLVTDRAPIVMEAKDGTIVEVFEWRSDVAIQSAHSNPRVLQLWERYNAVCEYVPIGSVEEAAQLFSEFTPI